MLVGERWFRALLLKVWSTSLGNLLGRQNPNHIPRLLSWTLFLSRSSSDLHAHLNLKSKDLGEAAQQLCYLRHH